MIRITVNGEQRQLADDATVAVLLETLSLNGRRLAVERNGEIVPRSEHARQPLAEGYRLKFVRAIGGG